jgi:hypothetical protein
LNLTLESFEVDVQLLDLPFVLLDVALGGNRDLFDFTDHPFKSVILRGHVGVVSLLAQLVLDVNLVINKIL